jgi:hypothetical protein
LLGWRVRGATASGTRARVDAQAHRQPVRTHALRAMHSPRAPTHHAHPHHAHTHTQTRTHARARSGAPGAQWMTSGVAKLPIWVLTRLTSAACSLAVGGCASSSTVTYA